MINHPEIGTDRGSMIMTMARCESWLYPCFFYSLFQFMEKQGILDPTCERDLFCLHYVFATRINQNLKMFKSGWNNDGFTTEVNRTPS